jgi:hypothetical protein
MLTSYDESKYPTALFCKGGKIMRSEGLNSLPRTGQHRTTKKTGAKGAEQVKAFAKTINDELEEMEQLIAEVQSPIKGMLKRGS